MKTLTFIIINILLMLAFATGIAKVEGCPANYNDRYGLSCDAYMDLINSYQWLKYETRPL